MPITLREQSPISSRPELPVTNMTDEELRQQRDLMAQMAPGEIYAQVGEGAPVYYVPSQRYVGGEDLGPFQQQTGVRDFMTQQNAGGNAARLQNIQQSTGAQMQGLENALRFNPEIASRFQNLSPADQMAASMVQQGKMSPKDFYAIAKKGEVDREKAMQTMLQQLNPQKGPLDLMKGGEKVDFSGKNIADLMNPQGDTSLEAGKPFPTTHINIAPGQGGAGGSNVSPEALALAKELGGTRNALKYAPQIQARMDAGQTIDQIRDSVDLSQHSKEFNEIARNAAQQMTVGKMSATRQKDTFDDIDYAAASGDPKRLANVLKRTAINVAGTTKGAEIMGKERAAELLGEIQSDLDAFQAAGGNTNFFSGNLSKLANKVGLVTDPKMAAIANRILLGLQTYRNEISGKAFSIPESKEYKSAFPGIDKIGTLNSALISSIRQNFQGDVDYFYRKSMGDDAYNSLILGQPVQQPSGTTLTGQDAEAEAWARANPNDPRSAAILQKLGLQ